MALAAREAEYRMLAEHSTDFLSRHTIDGTFLYASPVSRAMLGWDSEAMLGRTPKQLEHGPPRRHGDHRAQLGRRAARGALAHRRLPRPAPRRLDRVAGDDLPRRARPRRRGARDGLRVARHLRAQERRARARPPRAARRAHRPAQPHAVPRPPRPGAAALAPARPRRGRRLPRPRSLQARQRLAGPQGRRPPARRRGHAAELGPAPLGHAGALRRRRADAAVRGHRRRRGRARDRPAPARDLRRALPRAGRRGLPAGEHRHRALARRLRGARGPHPRRRRRDVPRQGPRPGRRALRRGHAPGRARPPRARGRAAPRHRARRAAPALPAAGLAGRRAHRGLRGARALGASRARPRAARVVHPAGRGDRAHRPHRRLGPATRRAPRCGGSSTRPG